MRILVTRTWGDPDDSSEFSELGRRRRYTRWLGREWRHNVHVANFLHFKRKVERVSPDLLLLDVADDTPHHMLAKLPLFAVESRKVLARRNAWLGIVVSPGVYDFALSSRVQRWLADDFYWRRLCIFMKGWSSDSRGLERIAGDHVCGRDAALFECLHGLDVVRRGRERYAFVFPQAYGAVERALVGMYNQGVRRQYRVRAFENRQVYVSGDVGVLKLEYAGPQRLERLLVVGEDWQVQHAGVKLRRSAADTVRLASVSAASCSFGTVMYAVAEALASAARVGCPAQARLWPMSRVEAELFPKYRV